MFWTRNSYENRRSRLRRNMVKTQLTTQREDVHDCYCLVRHPSRDVAKHIVSIRKRSPYDKFFRRHFPLKFASFYLIYWLLSKHACRKPESERYFLYSSPGKYGRFCIFRFHVSVIYLELLLNKGFASHWWFGAWSTPRKNNASE